MDQFMGCLPNMADGYLPLFVLIVGMTAVTNAMQCYQDTSYLQRIYSPPQPSSNLIVKTTNITRTVEEDNLTPPEQRRPSVASIVSVDTPASPVTPLSARTFGTWNLAVGVARMIAAYHMNERSWYLMSIYTNVIGIIHFGSEAFVYKTATPQSPWLAPVSVAVIGLLWHIIQINNYVKA